MNKIAVLNPLIKGLLDSINYQSLLEKLKHHEFFVTDPIPGIDKVREQYKKWCSEASKTPVIDSRCPYIVDLIHKEFPALENLLAPIDPILITGAEIRRKELGENDAELYIVAPCKGFERYTTHKRLVYTWQDFRDVINFYPPQKVLESTPIPIGFFGELGFKVYSATGEEKCKELLKNYPNDAQLLELLFCEGGCHKGDGL